MIENQSHEKELPLDSTPFQFSWVSPAQVSVKDDPGIGFCSHLPDKTDKAVLFNVTLENKAGKVR